MKKEIIKILILVLVLVISFSVTYSIRTFVSDKDVVEVAYSGSNKNTSDADINDTDNSRTDTIDDNRNIVNERNLETSVTIADSIDNSFQLGCYILDVVIVGPVCDYNTMGYNLTININNLPKKAVAHYFIHDKLKGDTVSKSNNGRFRAIPATESGEYSLYVHWTDSLGYPGLAVDTLLTGFKPFEKPKIKKLEANELENLINKCDRKLSVRNTKISSALRLEFTNIMSEEKRPETIDEIYNKIKFGMWSSINVTSVDYNDDNQVVQITMLINHSEE